MKNQKKILIITHVNFWLQEMGSHQRIYKLLNYLKQNYEINIAYIQKQKQNDMKYIKELGYENNIIFVENLKASPYDKKAVELFLDKHPVLKFFFDDTLTAKIATLLKTKKYTHILIEYIHLSYMLSIFKDEIKILDTHDIMNKRNDVFKKNNKTHWINISEVEELSIFNLYDTVLSIQKSEYNYLKNNNINVLNCPHPISPIKKSISDINKINKNIVFVGAYNEGNNHAIKYFIQTIWKYFEDIPNIQLFIYGTVSKFVKDHKLVKKNIILKGKVKDIKDIYKDADIAINPVQIGGGLKIKNIESMAYSIPLITTTEGSNGIEDEINKSYLIANTKDEWIQTLISLIISPQLQQKLSKNSYTYIAENFNQEISFSKLKEFIA